MEYKVGDRLRDLRKSRGWTQGELAKEADVNKSTVTNYEIDKRQSGNVAIIKKLAGALGVSIDYLVNGEGTLSENILGKSGVNIPGMEPKHVEVLVVDDCKASAGNPAVHFDPDRYVHKEYFPLPVSSGGKVNMMIQIEGNSMSPKYEPGEWVIAVKEEEAYPDKDYVLFTEKGVLIKRLLHSDDEKVYLKSINSETYKQTVELEIGEVQAIFRVVYCMRI